MRSLAVDLATSFIDDAMSLATRFGRAVLRLATAPINRIANACDVGGILTKRRMTRRMRRDQEQQKGHVRSRRRGSLFGHIPPFGHLSHLT